MALGNPFASGVDPIGGLVVFAVSLLIGGVALYVATNYIVYRDEPGGMTFGHAVLTALLGAVAWALLAWIPLIGSLVALVGWAAIIRWRYPGGWTEAAFIGVAAWATAVVALAALELIGIGSVSALGIPGA